MNHSPIHDGIKQYILRAIIHAFEKKNLSEAIFKSTVKCPY